MKFVKNAWYVAGWGREFDHSLKSKTILAQNIVMYRSQKNQIIALDDCCPHKLLPLSKGKLINDQIICGYHGMTFGTDGVCTRIPGQNNIPPSAKVHSYQKRRRQVN